MSAIRVNMVSQVNSAEIRRETVDGREHIVVPSYTLPDGVVMNNGLYPKEEIDKAWPSIEGTLAPFGHPQVNGKYVSAFEPEAINRFHVGAFNRNAKRVGNRVYVEKWIDVEYAQNSALGRQLLEAVEKGEPIHTSTGIMLEQVPVTNAKGYGWIAKNMELDHDAILVNQVGAATPEQGVGLMVNTADATPAPVVNLANRTYGELSSLLNTAVRSKFAVGQDGYAYVEDFDGASVVFSSNEGYFEVDYAIDGNTVTLGDNKTAVKRKTSWVSNMLEKVARMFNTEVHSEPSSITPNHQEAPEMTKEELAAALKEFGETLTTNFNQKIDAVETKLNAQLQANQLKAEESDREIVKQHMGEIVANALTGDALKSAADKYRTAAPIVPGAVTTNSRKEQEFMLPEA